MKFTVSSSLLQSRLQVLSRAISSKNTLPIFDNFLFSINGGRLTLTAADMETSLVTTIDIDSSEGEGQIALSAKLMLNTLKEFSEQPLTFDINEENLEMTIRSASGVYNFIGQNGKEFPMRPDPSSDSVSITIPTEVLLSGIQKSAFAAADDELRPVMNGIFIDLTESDITFAATDSQKLARVKSVAVKSNLSELDRNGRASFILPKKPIELLKAILSKASGEANIVFDQKNACVTLADYTMRCQLVEGRFPNYNSVIPTDHPFTATINRQSLLNALRRVSIFSNAGTNLVKLEFSETEVVASTQDIDFSTSGKETIACNYSGDPLKIGFRSTAFIEILSIINSDEVIIQLKSSAAACVIVPLIQEENEDALVLLVPMMLNE